jgi:hypothetical protein
MPLAELFFLLVHEHKITSNYQPYRFGIEHADFSPKLGRFYKLRLDLIQLYAEELRRRKAEKYPEFSMEEFILHCTDSQHYVEYIISNKLL